MDGVMPVDCGGLLLSSSLSENLTRLVRLLGVLQVMLSGSARAGEEAVEHRRWTSVEQWAAPQSPPSCPHQ